MLLLFYCIENKKEVSRYLPTSKIKSVPSRPIRIQSKAYGELFLSANQLLLSAGGTWLSICANIRTCTSNANFTYYLGVTYLIQLREEDSNLRPPGYEPDELPTALPHNIFSSTQQSQTALQRMKISCPSRQTNVPYLVEMSGVEPESTKMLMILFYQVAQDLKFWALQPITAKEVDCILDGQSIPVRILG